MAVEEAVLNICLYEVPPGELLVRVGSGGPPCSASRRTIPYPGSAPVSPARPHEGRALPDDTITDDAALSVPSAAVLGRAAPSFVLILLADAAVLWAAVAGEWSVLAVVIACVIDGLADGVLAWLRARASFAAGSATDARDAVLVREFIKTYLIVVGVQAVVAYMVFGGLLLKPGGEAPVAPGAPFVTWQFWAVVAGLVLVRILTYLWDFVRGGEAEVVPPEAVVSEPLRRLFVLQFGVLAGALVVYWVFHSALAGLVVLLIAKTVADLVLAVLERLRVARIVAAVAAGIQPRGVVDRRSRARRGGRKRRR